MILGEEGAILVQLRNRAKERKEGVGLLRSLVKKKKGKEGEKKNPYAFLISNTQKKERCDEPEKRRR